MTTSYRLTERRQPTWDTIWRWAKENRNSKKSVKSVRLTGVGVYGEKDFFYIFFHKVEKYVSSLVWRNEGMLDDDSQDNEEDNAEEDWLRQSWRSETGSDFHFPWGAGGRPSKSNNRGSTSTTRRLERDKVMQVRGLRGSENLVCNRVACSQFVH